MTKKRKFQALSSSNNDKEEIISYRFDGNVRFVEPYVHKFTSFAKGRWLGRSIIDIVVKEFGGHPELYWERAIQLGFIRINGERVNQTYEIKNSDHFTHITHRHEPPVMGTIKFVGETEFAFAVNKPASMPVHPCGAYRFNSMMMLLTKEPITPHQVNPLHLVHRLDRVTSGLVVLAKSSEAAASISKEIREHSTEKVYLARVRGRFPTRLGHMQELTDPELTALPTDGIDDELGDDDAVSKAPSSSSSSKNIQSDRELPSYEETGRSTGVGYGRSSRLLLDEGGFIFVRCPIAVVSFREGIHICDSKGKVSLSAFRSLGYDESSDTSLVECRPYTGRTHQLRLHLEFVGNPIANDPCYGGEIFYGDSDKRIKAVDTLQLLQQQGLKPMTKVPHFSLRPNELARIAESKAVSSEAQSNIGELVDDPQGADESDAAFLGRTCRYCKGHLCGDVERWLHCDGIWLHALRYCGNNWAFETTLPDWAMNNNFGAINALKLNK